MTRKRLLLIAHTPSPNTKAMRDALLSGAGHEDIDDVELSVIEPLKTVPDDVLKADGILLLTTENLAYMSGAMKDFFDRCYYPCLEQTQGRPYGLIVRAGNDGTGACLAVERITTGLRWRKIDEPLVCRGAWQDRFLGDCETYGMQMAAGLEAGVF